jgi:diacylglycerol kinase family enzyme
VVGALKAFATLEKFTVSLTVDGETKIMRASAVLVANFGAVMNDLISFGDGIQRDDGVLNACVYSPRNMVDALRILLKMARKKFTPDPCIYYAAGSNFFIETEPPRIGQADGELIGIGPFRVTVEPLAGRVLVPRRG